MWWLAFLEVADYAVFHAGEEASSAFFQGWAHAAVLGSLAAEAGLACGSTGYYVVGGGRVWSVLWLDWLVYVFVASELLHLGVLCLDLCVVGGRLPPVDRFDGLELPQCLLVFFDVFGVAWFLVLSFRRTRADGGPVGVGGAVREDQMLGLLKLLSMCVRFLHYASPVVLYHLASSHAVVLSWALPISVLLPLRRNWTFMFPEVRRPSSSKILPQKRILPGSDATKPRHLLDLLREPSQFWSSLNPTSSLRDRLKLESFGEFTLGIPGIFWKRVYTTSVYRLFLEGVNMQRLLLSWRLLTMWIQACILQSWLDNVCLWIIHALLLLVLPCSWAWHFGASEGLPIHVLLLELVVWNLRWLMHASLLALSRWWFAAGVGASVLVVVQLVHAWVLKMPQSSSVIVDLLEIIYFVYSWAVVVFLLCEQGIVLVRKVVSAICHLLNPNKLSVPIQTRLILNIAITSPIQRWRILKVNTPSRNEPVLLGMTHLHLRFGTRWLTYGLVQNWSPISRRIELAIELAVTVDRPRVLVRIRFLIDQVVNIPVHILWIVLLVITTL